MNSQNENIENESKFIEGSCIAILDTAKTVHSEEQARFTQYESKTNIGLAFVAIILVAYISWFFNQINNESLNAEGIYSGAFNILIFIFFSLSIVSFLKAIKSGEYEQIDLDNIVDLKFAQDPVEVVNYEIAATYRAVVRNNKATLEEKIKHYDSGLVWATRAFLLLVIQLIIEGVINYVI